jgi:hypothetical protein
MILRMGEHAVTAETVWPPANGMAQSLPGGIEYGGAHRVGEVGGKAGADMHPMTTGPFQVGDQALFDLYPLFALGNGPSQSKKALAKVMEYRPVRSKETAQQRGTFLEVAKSVHTGRTAWRQFDQNQLQSGALAKLPGEKMVQIGHVQQTGLDIDPGLFYQAELPFNYQPDLLQPVDIGILAKKWIKPDDQSHHRLAI